MTCLTNCLTSINSNNTNSAENLFKYLLNTPKYLESDIYRTLIKDNCFSNKLIELDNWPFLEKGVPWFQWKYSLDS